MTVETLRRTKIVATIGPASESDEMIARLISAGVNVFRLNFSHGTVERHAEVAARIRAHSTAAGTYTGILADLQGPKIRIGTFADGAIQLEVGDRFRLDLELPDGEGNQQAVGLEYRDLCSFVVEGDTLLLDDGRVRLQVDDVEEKAVNCTVLIGGALSSRKGINRLGGGLAAPALTTKDIADIASLTQIDPDFVAVSFVSSAEDIHLTRRLLKEHQLTPGIIAKIERAEVVASSETMSEILAAVEGVMVARGDLGVEVGDAQLVGIQKALIEQARNMNRVVITATQMMESMISSAMPTRAEVFDVANAVLDGTDAVMLSGETAVGRYPTEVVRAMATTSMGAELHPQARISHYRIDRQFSSANETIAMSAMYAANHYGHVKGIACFTESGITPVLMSRLHSGLPIFALSHEAKTLNTLAICRGVVPLHFDFHQYEADDLESAALAFLKDRGYFSAGDSILLTWGQVMGKSGSTNVMKILTVE